MGRARTQRALTQIGPDDKKEGLWKYYYKNGNVESQGKYKNDELEGLWMFFNKSGKTIDKKNYTRLRMLEESMEE